MDGAGLRGGEGGGGWGAGRGGGFAVCCLVFYESILTEVVVFTPLVGAFVGELFCTCFGAPWLSSRSRNFCSCPTQKFW